MPSFSVLPAGASTPSTPISGDEGFEIQVAVDDLAETPRIRVLDHKTGETHFLSIEAVEKIRNFSTFALRGLQAVNEMRFVYAHPCKDAAISARMRQSNLRPCLTEDGQEVHLGNWLTSRSDTSSESGAPCDGEPKLVWVTGDHAGNGCGWNLVLHGSAETSLGFAPWNDAEGILRLVNMLEDRQSVFVLSGVMDSASTARLSSRLTALSLRRARKLPAIRLKLVRDLLTEAGLAGGGPSGVQNACARGRVLPIQVDDHAVPVAVALLAPRRPVTCAPLPFGLNDLPWQERQRIVAEIEEAGRALWLEKAKHVLTSSGWRLVDLPQPSHAYYSWRVRPNSGGTNNLDLFYVTRINDEAWGEISTAASAAAADLNLNRTSLI